MFSVASATAASRAGEPNSPVPVPVAASVMLFDDEHLARGPATVDRAARVGAGRVQLVVNLHVRLSPDLRVLQYGVLRDRRRAWDENRNFRPLTPALLAEFESGLRATFRQAFLRRLDVAVLPHLDAAGPVTEWRNRFRFDPLATIDGFSYRSAMIEPLVRAIEAASPGERTVWFALAGEMGRSVAEFPASYDRLRESVVNADAACRVGLSLNFSEFAGGGEIDRHQRRDYQRLLAGCDFLGVSCYRTFTPPASRRLFQDTVTEWLAEMAAAGLAAPASTRLHLSEVGLGGGPPGRKRYTPETAAATPWLGVSHQNADPWRSAGMKSFRRDYYQALLSFLSGDRGRAGDPATRTEAAFLWSEGSWAPLAVDQPRFADEAIIRSVLRHNRAAAGGSRAGTGRVVRSAPAAPAGRRSPRRAPSDGA